MTRLTSKIHWSIFACLVAASSAWSQTRELGAEGELLDGIAALVDEGVVLKSELQDRIDVVTQNFAAQQRQLPAAQRSQLPPLSVLEQQVLDQLIIEQIQLQRAERIGIEIGDDILNEVMSSIAQNLGMTLEQLPDALAADGIDYATFREQQRQDLIINQLERRDVVNSISINPRELQQCLARTEATQTDEFDYNVSHILIGFSPSSTPEEIAEAEERVNQVKSELESGADFAQLAVTYSDSQTALQGGSLGWRKGSELPTIFASVVVGLEPGENSDPIQTAGGFHLVRLNEMRGAERVVVDQVRARHILITPNEILDDNATMQKLIGVRNQILGGDDFAAVASSVSEDVVSAAAGGDLGWTAYDVYVDEFRDTLETLEIGVLSEPFRTRFGWHIVEVTDRRSYDTTDDLKERDCSNQIANSKIEEERELWLRRLRDQAFILSRL